MFIDFLQTTETEFSILHRYMKKILIHQKASRNHVSIHFPFET